jgi:hypothetical protein
MRRAVCVAVAVMMAALLSSPAFAASDSDVATASVTVEEVVDVALTWQTTGTSHIDLGPIAPGELPTPTEILIMDVAHNLVGNPQYSVQAEVDKTSGPDWVGSIDLYLGPESLVWYQADFGTPQTFGNPVGQEGPFQELFAVDFWVAAGQPEATYNFEFTITLTSL